MVLQVILEMEGWGTMEIIMVVEGGGGGGGGGKKKKKKKKRERERGGSTNSSELWGWRILDFMVKVHQV